MAVVRGLAIDRFAGPHPRLAADYLATQERLGCIRPAWRYAWVRDDGAVGSRVVFWGRPGSAAPSLVDVVVADDAATVDAVLATSLAELAVGSIDYLADRAAGAPRSPHTEPAALERAGFALVSTQIRLVHTGPVAAAPAPAGVVLRSIAEIGDAGLAELIAATQIGSHDRATRDGAAADELAGLMALDHDPAWWTIALGASPARPLGFVMPVRTDDGGHVIAFIGVVPEARGRGLGRALLAAGTAALRAAAPTAAIRADVDEANPAMLRAAAATGYQAAGARAHYRR